MSKRLANRPRRRLAAVGIALASFSFVATGSVQAATVMPAPSQPVSQATLYMTDSTYGDSQSPLYFQVFGEGFRPGEAVTLDASLVGGAASSDSIPLPPVSVTANDYGEIAATIDAGGVYTPGDGFVIRARGDEHAASIIDLVLSGAASQTNSGN